jgi:hypothetical protein
MPAFGASAKMQPPSAQSQAFDATCSTWLGCWVDTIPLRLHRLLSDFLLLQLLLIDGRTEAALFDSLNLDAGAHGAGSTGGFQPDAGATWPTSSGWCWAIAILVGLMIPPTNSR